VLSLHVAQEKVDTLTAELARDADGDGNARRMVQIMACFGPLIAAISHALPEPSEPTSGDAS
jgi:hypothetical protein